LQNEAAETLDRILRRSLLLDDELDRATGDPALLVHPRRRPFRGAPAALASRAGDSVAQRQNADLDRLVLPDRWRAQRRQAGGRRSDPHALYNLSTCELHPHPPNLSLR